MRHRICSHEGRQVKEVKDRLHDPRFVDRYLRNVTDVTNVTGNSPRVPFSDKVRSLRGSEYAPLPLSRDARRCGIVKSRLCELSDSRPVFHYGGREGGGGRDLRFQFERFCTEIFVIPDFHATGLLYGEEFLRLALVAR